MGLMQDSSKIFKAAALATVVVFSNTSAHAGGWDDFKASVKAAGNQIGEAVSKGGVEVAKGVGTNTSGYINGENTVRGTVALKNGQVLTCFKDSAAGSISNGYITNMAQGKGIPTIIKPAQGGLAVNNCDELAQKKMLTPYNPATNSVAKAANEAAIPPNAPRQVGESCGHYSTRRYPQGGTIEQTAYATCLQSDIKASQRQIRADQQADAAAAKAETTDHMKPIVTSTKPKTKLAQKDSSLKND